MGNLLPVFRRHRTAVSWARLQLLCLRTIPAPYIFLQGTAPTRGDAQADASSIHTCDFTDATASRSAINNIQQHLTYTYFLRLWFRRASLYTIRAAWDVTHLFRRVVDAKAECVLDH